MLIIAGTLTWAIMVCYPLYLSYAFERSSKSNDGRRLSHILEDDAGYHAVFTFCAAEFSSENVAFYARAREFERRVTALQGGASELIVEARMLYEKLYRSVSA